MRLRSKLVILGLAAMAGYIVSRPDLRNELAQMMESFKLRLNEALEKGKEAAVQKEQELEQEVRKV